MILFELTKEAVKKKEAILIDPKRWYYIDRHGTHLRHAKIVFSTDRLQDQLVTQWRYHDPSKAQDKCIEVLLGKIGKKWYPISTLRTLSPECVIKWKESYSTVPKKDYIKAIKLTDALDNKEKKALIDIIKKLPDNSEKRKIEKPIFINTKKDITKLERKRKK